MNLNKYLWIPYEPDYTEMAILGYFSKVKKSSQADRLNGYS